MKQSKYNLSTWQVLLILLGVGLIWGPDLISLVESVVNGLSELFNAEFLFSRAGAVAVGVILILIVGVTEFFKDYGDKPKSKYVK